jgi:pteridine reductase
MRASADAGAIRSTLAGKTVLVTGGARRVGAAICRRLHAAGANIAIHYRTSRSEAARLQRRLDSQRPQSACCFHADLLEVDALGSLVKSVLDRFGALDALVNNASSFYATPLGRIDLPQWNDLIGTNLQAPLFLVQAAREELLRRRGAVVNIADIHAERPLAGHLVYTVAKAGLVALTRSLARELAPKVRVNAIAPGAIAWPESGVLVAPELQKAVVASTPLGRTGSPADIAAAVHFLVAEAPFVTGQVLAVDGGRSIFL